MFIIFNSTQAKMNHFVTKINLKTRDKMLHSSAGLISQYGQTFAFNNTYNRQNSL